MIVEREFAGFVLPFAAGIILAGVFSTTICYALSSTAMASAAVGCLVLAQVQTSTVRKEAGMTAISIIALFCGIFCRCNSIISAVSCTSETGYFASLAQDCCTGLQAFTDQMPFKREETSAIIKALLTGEKTDIPKEIREAFRASGASHILALSGMHLGIIYGIVIKSLMVMGNSHKAKTIKGIAAIAICGAYTLAVGAGESIVRAFLFITISETAQIFNRYRSIRQSLLAALLIQLCISPESVSSISFQLSYAAMAGIAFIHPRMKGFWPEGGSYRNPIRKIWESASLSISCQLTTAPIAWVHFQTFPQHFILTNLIAIPLTCLVIPVSILGMILHKAGICPDFILDFNELLICALTGSLKVIASM